MLNLTRWDKYAYQIDFERTGFYFLRKLVVAVREPDDKSLIFEDTLDPKDVRNFKNSLETLTDKIELVSKDVFIETVNAAYYRALLRGVRHFGIGRFHSKGK